MEQGIISQILAMLVAAIIFIALFRRVGLPVVLAYLMTGIIAGPNGINWFSNDDIHLMGELGIALLMFSLGLEFSIPRLWAMRKMVFGLGFGQMLLTSIVIAAVLLNFGFEGLPALMIGLILALSSTAIVLKLFNELGSINQPHGERGVSVLLFQDVAVVPLLILLPLVGGQGPSLSLTEIALQVFSGVFAIVLLVTVGRWLLPKFFDEVARAKTNELFVLATLAVALITGAITHSIGLSMALGAFVAGLLLGESQYKSQLEADIRPFRDLLMGVFFISIGMLLNFEVVIAHYGVILSLLLVFTLVKAIVLSGLVYSYDKELGVAVTTGVSLAQIGEFSFVLLALAADVNLLSGQWSNILVMVGVLSMAMTPWMVKAAPKLGQKFSSRKIKQQQYQPNEDIKNHVVLCGFGRVGQSIGRFLHAEGIEFVAIDSDPVRAKEALMAGEPVLFGDPTNRALLRMAGIKRANMLVVCFKDKKGALALVQMVKAQNPDLKVLVRTTDDQQLKQIQQAGVDLVVPEYLEGSLMMVSQVLHQLGVPIGKILKRLEQERRDHYQNLHNFYSGDKSDITKDFLHGVHVLADSYLVGRPINQLDFNQFNIQLDSIKRDGHSLPLDASFELQEHDIVLLAGKARHIERAEAYIHNG
ncbi:monovalent cation:proton antiporter family protein [Paraferrimonas sp. SM1919]|uniref:monovalent cation:proton antiporter family protein n=1 Tax=Paraferrimonas sp. SM1919 TaxID=2662263 RepID=UPI0013CFE871|nr:monovalent cation:proton antiporter family protein [Paraferrimonas sp. SM1919]